jgi:hypothetical protein
MEIDSFCVYTSFHYFKDFILKSFNAYLLNFISPGVVPCLYKTSVHSSGAITVSSSSVSSFSFPFPSFFHSCYYAIHFYTIVRRCSLIFRLCSCSFFDIFICLNTLYVFGLTLYESYLKFLIHVS